MKILKTLTVPVDGERILIEFGHPDTAEELSALHRLRYAIYNKYGYIDPAQFANEEDVDRCDEAGECVYFYARVGDRPIGFVRLIQGSNLPIFSAYSFVVPLSIRNLDQNMVCELGRLVVDKYSETVRLPRNLVLLFLTLCLAEYTSERGIQVAYAFLKKKLMSKLHTLGLPFTLITPFTLTYPEHGPMGPYFYNPEDPAEPAYFELKPVLTFLDKTVKDKSLLKEVEPNQFELQTNLYTRFLKVMGVI